MKQLLLLAIALLSMFSLVAANIQITEVMHSPEVMAHSDGEWLEIYNDGLTTINLTDWTIDGSDFDDTTIGPGEYLVIARELLDGDDADLDSFESYWGNNNGIWDEDFKAVDGSFTFSASDTITLTNGDYIEEFTYDESFGGADGLTIQRVTLDEWEEGPYGGTPGFGFFGGEVIDGSGIEINVEVSNNGPNIDEISILTDDSGEEGIQIMPNVELVKEVEIQVTVTDNNGFEDIETVEITVNNKTTTLEFIENTTAIQGIYQGVFVMDYFDLAGIYEVEATANDASSETKETTSFEYLGILSTELNTLSLDFDLSPGEDGFDSIEVVNTGNIIVDSQVSADDLSSLESTISAENIYVLEEGWLSLYTPIDLDTNILPLVTKEIELKISVPIDAQTGSYNGRVIIESMEG
jgi:hypothetical protein